MLTEDYLMRMIRLATAAIARAFGLKAATLYQDALMVLDQALGQLLGLPAEIIHRMDDQSIIALCTNSSGLNLDQLYLVADLILSEGDIYESIHDAQESSWRYLRALNLFLKVYLNGNISHLPEPDEKIDLLVSKLSLVRIPTELQYPLFYYYEKCGAYASAVQLLDTLVQNNPTSADLKTEQIEFFQRMGNKTDSELIKGGISAEFVEHRLRGLSLGSYL